MPLVILIGENHVKNQEQRESLIKLCKDNGTLIATEHMRETPKYDSISSEFGDMVCNLHTAVGSMYIEFLTKKTIDSYDSEYVKIIYGYLEKGVFDKLEGHYSKRYGHQFSFEKLRTFVGELYTVGRGNPEYLKRLLSYLNELIKSSKFIVDKERFILNIKNYVVQSSPEALLKFKYKLELEIRDLAFVENIKELILMANEYGKSQLILIMGEKHLIGVQELLKSLEIPYQFSLDVCKNYDDFRDKHNAKVINSSPAYGENNNSFFSFFKDHPYLTTAGIIAVATVAVVAGKKIFSSSPNPKL